MTTPTEQRYGCTKCTRTDLTLTKNGRIRSHAADGKKAGPDNPHCPGGSDWPSGHEEAAQAPVTESGGPNRYRAPLSTSQPRTEPSGAVGACTRCGEPRDGHAHDETGETVHPHDYVWGDDDNGHSGSFCRVCGQEEPDDPNEITPPASPVSEVDAFLGMDRDEDDYDDEDSDKGPWITARHDGTCSGCGGMVTGDVDEIRADGEGGWEAKDCCGEDGTEAAPVGTAVAKTRNLQLPVRNGRYKYPHPVTGKPTSGTRVTTFIKAASDSIALDQWKERMTVLGLVTRPDLQKKIAATLSGGKAPYAVARTERDFLNGVVEQAKDAADAKYRARKGTILHKHTEEIDSGRRVVGDVPTEFRQAVTAYVMAMRDAGLKLLPNMIERSTAITEFGGVAGTFDRIAEATRELKVTFTRKTITQVITIHPGDHVVVDVKTGDDLSYNWLEIIIQEAIYATGVNQNGVAVSDGGSPAVWRWADAAEMGIGFVREDVGIVAHMPYGGSTCTIYGLDIDTGWKGAELCGAVKAWRKATPENVSGAILESMAPEPLVIPPVTAPPEAGPRAIAAAPRSVANWEEMFRAVRTREEGNAAWQAAKDAGLTKEVIKVLLATVDMNRPLTLRERAARVTTSDEANALWAEARGRMQEIGGPGELNELVKVMKGALSKAGS
jgi:hypothetical protein